MKHEKTFAERLALPEESCSLQAVTRLCGRRSLIVERHRGLLEYTDGQIRIAVRRGSICVVGSGLRIVRMSRGELEIRGSIQRLELE